MLNAMRVKEAKPKEKEYQLSDGSGLYLLVRPSGKKTWIVRWMKNGKAVKKTIGAYPQLSLKEARLMRDQAKEQSSRKTLFFRDLFELWAKAQDTARRSVQDKFSLMERKVLPYLGETPAAELTAAEIQKLSQSLYDQGHTAQARYIIQIIATIYSFSALHGWTDIAPTLPLKSIRFNRRIQHRASRTKPEEIGQLLQGLDQLPEIPTVLGLQILPYVFTRISELSRARWTELDLAAGLWTIPADRMKMDRPHIVPLSKQAQDKFARLKDITGKSPWLFPRAHDGEPVGIDMFNHWFRKVAPIGYATLQGWRNTASATLNTLNYRKSLIEMQLAHDSDIIRTAYSHGQYLDERTAMMQDYANFLDACKAGEMTARKLSAIIAHRALVFASQWKERKNIPPGVDW